MESTTDSPMKNKIFTIPNALTAVRLLLLPLIVWLYVFRQNYFLATIVLLLSGITDILDGYIARHFHMISDLGKALDPIADKLTQGVTLLCLGTRFRPLLFLGITLAAKEIITGICALYVVQKTQLVKGAVWHGKLLTVLLYLTLALHLIWIDIPYVVTITLSVLCFALMIFSFVCYLRNYYIQLMQGKQTLSGKES